MINKYRQSTSQGIDIERGIPGEGHDCSLQVEYFMLFWYLYIYDAECAYVAALCLDQHDATVH